MASLGIDFGTSNSAAGFVRDGVPCLVEMEPGMITLPTAVFFDFDARAMRVGHPAAQALLAGEEGRFMRALKRVLGTSLMHEKRQLLNERITFVDIIARFLAHVKAKAERQAGVVFDHAVSGRPVVFHGQDDPREAQAEADLRACYHAAGFASVSFLPEPAAAALAADVSFGSTGLIVDIGGGTSDFSVFARGETGITILANHGVRIGGTDFDRAVSISKVMPLMGLGSPLRNAIGPGSLPAPKALFHDLATWEKIPFLYGGKTLRDVRAMQRQAEAPERFARLHTVLENELGHDLAFAVEAGKIAANGTEDRARIELNAVERGLSVPLNAADLTDILAPQATLLDAAVTETLALAGMSADQIDAVVYVGGSSLMDLVTHIMRTRFPASNHAFSEVFTAVADGLALATGEDRNR